MSVHQVQAHQVKLFVEQRKQRDEFAGRQLDMKVSLYSPAELNKTAKSLAREEDPTAIKVIWTLAVRNDSAHLHVAFRGRAQTPGTPDQHMSMRL